LNIVEAAKNDIDVSECAKSKGGLEWGIEPPNVHSRLDVRRRQGCHFGFTASYVRGTE
jgi:hypothetical protein